MPPAPQAATPVPASRPAAPAKAPAMPKVPLDLRVEPTPNPDALKFVANLLVLPRGSLVANAPDEAQGYAFAEALFELDGVRTVFATKNFVTVTRTPAGPEWGTLEPQVRRALDATLGA